MINTTWSLERLVSIIGGSVVLVSLGLGRAHSDRWRLLTAWVGANLVFNGLVGWCPASLILSRLGVRREAELAAAS